MRRSTWPALCACAALLAALAHAAPQQDTLVVARSEDVDETTTAAVATLGTSEGPLLPIKLMSMQVRSEVTLRYAHTAVVTRMRNPDTRAQEATFSILLPDTAFISGFTMILDGISYKAYVKEKEEAKQIYTDAVAQGLGTALVAAKVRDSNHFTVSVNVEPSTEAVFNLTYEELLDRRNSIYSHAINLHPGSVVPEFKVEVHIRESTKITVLQVLELGTGSERDSTDAYVRNPSVKIEKSPNERKATITFTPTPEEQRELMKIYAFKVGKSMALSQYRQYYSEPENTADGVLGQFVVQYDVDRSTDSEVLVNDDYFVHFFAPTNLPVLNKHVVFVLDTSYSMHGSKIEQLKKAMTSILDELKTGDFFNIVEFNSAAKVHDLSKEITPQSPPRRMFYAYMQEYQHVALQPAALASPENIQIAKLIVNSLAVKGGTNIAQALIAAVELVNKGVGRTENGFNDVSPPEPVIIFLTDGQPSVGEVNQKKIITKVSDINFGIEKASIYTLAFGGDADRDFLRKLSLRNEGFTRHIYEGADAALQLRNFYAQVSSPLLSNVRFVYPEDQVQQESITKDNLRTFYDGSEIVVAGRISALARTLTPRITGFGGVEQYNGKRKFEKALRVPTKQKSDEELPLERLWAYLTIRQLLDAQDTDDEDKLAYDKKSPEKQALELALKYSFVTPLTSLVVVKPNATTAVDAESVDKGGPGGPGGSARPSTEGGYYPGQRGKPGSPGTPGQPGTPAMGAPGGPGHSHHGGGYGSGHSHYGGGYGSGHSHRGGGYGSGHSHHGGGYGSGYGSWGSKLPAAGSGSLGRPTKPPYLPTSTPDWLPELQLYDDILPALGPEDKVKDIFSSGGSTIPEATYAPPSTQHPDQNIFTGGGSTVPDEFLVPYHLQDFQWLRTFVDPLTDTLDLPVNGTLIKLKLSKMAFGKTFPGLTCSPALDAKVGTCEYLAQCEAAKTITIQEYETTYCNRFGYAGVCCPKTT